MGVDRQRQVIRFPFLLAVPSALALASPVVAASAAQIDLPAGRLGDAVALLATQARISVSVPDAGLWARPVPVIRGRMSGREAVTRLARAAGGKAEALAGGGWRITPARRARRAQPVTPAVLTTIAAVEPAGTDIIVTASKRDIRLGDYPATVSVLDGRDLALGGTGGTDAILARQANLSSTHLGAGRNKLFIRGIADSSFTGPTQATVGQYFGDVRLSYNAPDPDLKLYDIASVEVIEGPNGTLYGAGSLGGIVRVVRNAPRPGRVEASASAGVSATQHGEPGGDLGAMVNLPVAGDAATLRIVGYGVSEGGYIDNPARDENDVNRTDTYGARATLRLLPGDGWTVDLGGTFQKIHGADSQYADRDGPRLTRSTLVDQGFDGRYALADLVIVKDWDDLRLVSSTGLASQKLDERYDATVPEGMADAPPDASGDGARQWPLLAQAAPLAPQPLVFAQNNDTRFFSSETRLSRPMRDGFGWVMGISFLDNRARLTRSLGPVGVPTPLTGVTNRIREYTGYGEASIELRHGLLVTAGARLTHSRLSGEGEDVAVDVAFDRAVRGSRSETNVLPSLAVSANVLPDFILFARYQQGFRPGGLAVEGDFVRQFRRDQIASWEAGARYGAPGWGGFQLAATFSVTQWDDIQADFIDSAGLPTTANIGDGRIYSLAASAGLRPLPGLSVEAAFVYNDSKVSDPVPVFQLARLSQLPNVAQFSARGSVDYQTFISDALDLRLSANLRYVGSSRLGVGPVLGEAQGDYLDTALTARIGRPDFGVSFTVTNLADAVGNRFALGTPFLMNRIDQITPLRPRTVRLGFDARF
ncbi:Outer membrane receptor proteins, mostly Fe transport [Sphingomonas laterariae]|uniref:Outer membrane receptor proteins, mostly Fe transport n=1 Tax=Edaphosphingomonas laterariae TaxID=861865 RepID=A0A239GUM4_9SPHN|nr:TonB-dependent receptor [Sphingomonas laterariae]SNS72498.1 Outer membrane receptor proteins, mostly Fe transport [Sphingomonas laterariae]